MKKHRANLQIVLGMIVLFAASILSASDDQPPFSSRTSGVLSSGTEYSIDIRETAYIRRDGEPEDDGSQWGIDGGVPGTRVSTFDVVVRNQKIWIPRKLYIDLSNIKTATAYEFGGGLRVDLKGSDAAGSFRTSFLFAGWTIERLTRQGEFPDSRWEFNVIHSSIAAIEDDSGPPIPFSTKTLQPGTHSTSE